MKKGDIVFVEYAHFELESVVGTHLKLVGRINGESVWLLVPETLCHVIESANPAQGELFINSFGLESKYTKAEPAPGLVSKLLALFKKGN